MSRLQTVNLLAKGTHRMKKVILTAISVLALSSSFGVSLSHASEEGAYPLPNVDWSFEGPFGTYDKAALQRGLMVYRQVCSSCHAMKRVAYRNLTALGYSEDQVKAIAGEYTIIDGPNDEGEMFERPGRPSDKFKSPFANDAAATSANGEALPPDLSLITKAREGGADYVFGVLIGYASAPPEVTVLDGQYFNKHMTGNVIKMPPPLTAGAVAYEDGMPQTVEQYAKDVSTFLTWAAEPEMEQRKQMGFKVILFLIVFAALMYAVKRKIWAKVH